MRVLSVSYNPETDETKVHFNEEFKNADVLLQADVLSDILGDIQAVYNDRVNDLYKEVKK
jgi:hypothetical protein